MKPKQLEWINDEDSTYAESPFGAYIYCGNLVFLRAGDNEIWLWSGNDVSFDTAKQICQNDYDRRAYELLKDAQACFEDARLIKAAPKMLEALKECLSWVGYYCRGVTGAEAITEKLETAIKEAESEE